MVHIREQTTAPLLDVFSSDEVLANQWATSCSQVYQARVDAFFNVTCPDMGKGDALYPCNITGDFPVVLKSQWQPRGILPGTPQLNPQPSPPAVVVKGINPPPQEDCTEMSLSYPDWLLQDFVYVPSELSKTDPQSARMSFLLTSRAIDYQVSCQLAEGTRNPLDYPDIICSNKAIPNSRPDRFNSQPVIGGQYDHYSRWLRVEQNWTCGDVMGRHSYVQCLRLRLLLLCFH
jgi:hypothetical protein